MIFPCEVTLKRFVPAVKARTARILSEKYGFSQMEIAGALGLTQAAVSKYLAGKYGADVKGAISLPSVIEAARVAADGIADRKPIDLVSSSTVCTCCRELRAGGMDEAPLRQGSIRLNADCDVK
jgi:predicted transcriptional regulator